LFLGHLPAGWVAESPDPVVEQFTPQGTVAMVRQVTARFSETMVPLGDPRIATDAFEVTCPEAGSARWVDSRTWAYDFDRDLPAGVRCAFRLRPGLQSLAGKPVVGQRDFGFSTGGPAIRSSIPHEGDEAIEEEQAFVLMLDAEPSESSILKHVSFAVEGLPERVATRLLDGPDREAILKSHHSTRRSERPIVVLQAVQRFPNAAEVRLVWGKGVATASGVATDQDQVFLFKVRPEFKAEFTCEREHRKAGCIPLTSMALRFTSPTAWEQARRIAIAGPGGRRWNPEAPEHPPGAFVQRIQFKGPFPEKASFQVEVPADLRDDGGRPLINASAFPLAVRTEAFPPLAKFAARFGIVEWTADPVLPVTLRNLERSVPGRVLPVGAVPPAGGAGASPPADHMPGQVLRIPPAQASEILPWLRRVAEANRDHSVFGPPKPNAPVRAIAVPKPNGPKAFEVVGIPFRAPGLYIVELRSARLGASLLESGRPMYVATAALVTNLSVHFKWGRESSLAWVTALHSARPVPGADVAVHDCRGKVLWTGKTDARGIARMGRLPALRELPACGEYPRLAHDYAQSRALASIHQGLLVTARTQDDMTFVHSSWDEGIEPWRFRLPAGDFEGPMIAHTVFDRPLFRAGDTVHMKHLIRLRTQRGFAPVPPTQRPARVLLRHEGSRTTYELPARWDAAGIAESTWPLPREAKLGRYQVVLATAAPQPGAGPRRMRDSREVVSGHFRVEEFRVPLMRALIRPPAEPLVGASEFSVDVGVQYLAGGGAAKLPARLRTQIRPKTLPEFDAFEGFTFANGAVKEGIVRRGTDEDEAEGDAEDLTRRFSRGREVEHQRFDVVLDAAGTARAAITRLPRAAQPLELLAELEYRDPTGEVQTVSSRIPLWPSRWLAGVRPDGWMASREHLKVSAAAADVLGRPVRGAPIRVDVYEQKSYAHRKRLVGGFYAYEHVTETRRVGELCRGTTDAKGLLICEGKSPAEGNLMLQAAVTDTAGNITTAYQDIWVAGSAQQWFDVRESDRMDLLPERKRYEPGQTARLQVGMPFREATALVTVEREGILEATVVSLSGKDPVVTLPVRGAYAPNVFVSVLAVRGRVGGVQPTAMVDLGRPAFKLGMAEIRVGWRAHEVKVKVEPEKPVYRVRQKARVSIAVRTTTGQAPPRGTEVALAAVDEGLLELSPNESWKLLDSMMRPRGLAVETATAQMQVVGKRHFGLKALPQGGGGGRRPTRELFDTLLFWRGRVSLDAHGNATVEIPLNDSLTGFRIVAVASGPADRWGTGAATIRSTQDLMILPGIPPLVREGDVFRAEVTLRNATDRPMAVQAAGRVEGLATPLERQAVHLAPGEAKASGWDITAPIGARALRYEIEAGEAGGTVDRIRVTQQVVPAVPVRTFQATLLRWDGTLRQMVERPSDALPGRGGVQVSLRPTLTEGLNGVRDWMLAYPYTCLEQKVSRAVALRDEAPWREVAAALPSYLDNNGLLKYFPTLLWGSEVLTAYVLSLVHESGWTIPDDSRTKMEAGLRRFLEGKIGRRPELPTADLTIRKLAALEALARYGKADPLLLGSIVIEPNLWPTSAVLDWWSLLYRVPAIPQRDTRLAEAEQIVRARLSLQGTTTGFFTERADHLWWLMVSPDTNAVRLILHLLHARQWQDDLPRLLRGALARQRRGAWDLTTANAWGALAVERFSQTFEKAPVTGTTTATLAAGRRQLDWAQMPKGETLSFPWPAGRDDLRVEHEGSGNPWITLQAQAAIPLKAPLSSGYRITKTITPIEPREAGRWSRGDLARVRLTVEAQADMTWVVVNDPIPAGASHLGTGLARDSEMAREGEKLKGVWPACEERSFEAFRAYYSFVPKGSFTIEHTIRLNQSGRLHLPSTRVEALYSPEMFGELPNAPMEVQP
jgi:hypothetical protein